MRRSTLRAFSTGHTGKASAAAMCVDVLGRVLLEILGSCMCLTASLAASGPDRALGQEASHSFVRGTTRKDLRGVQGAVVRTSGGTRDAAGREALVAAGHGLPGMGKGKVATTTSTPWRRWASCCASTSSLQGTTSLTLD